MSRHEVGGYAEAMRPQVRDEYKRREDEASIRFVLWQKREALWQAALLVAVVVLAATLWRVVRGGQSAVISVTMAVVTVGLVPGWLGARRRGAWARRQVTFYGECLERVSGRKPQTGKTGEAFALGVSSDSELYAKDLEVFGLHSLFGMLATTRTEWGEGGLARLLLEVPEAPAIRARQHAVRELAPQVDLREAVALLGRSEFEVAPAGSFQVWLATGSARFPGWLRPVLTATTASWIAVLVFGLVEHWPGDLLLRNLGVIWGVQVLVSSRFRAEVLRELEAAKRLATGFRILREGVSLVGAQPFSAERLQQLAASGQGGGGDALRGLERVLALAEQRETGWVFALGLFAGLGTQTAISLANYRERQGAALRAQVAAWSEFEALVAVATYAAEHEGAVYPELLEPELLDSHVTGVAGFEADGLKHPLLPAEQAIGNGVRLGSGAVAGSAAQGPAVPQFLLVSGSNMAGKSTLLRSVGLCIVLARTGAPVPAERVRMTALEVGASIGLGDSLAEGRSKFLAEVARLRGILTLAERRRGGVLFLVDEVLSGTNSADRRVAAEAVVRGLVGAGAIGALSTHDLKLAEIADEAGLRGANVHMASPDEGDPLRFDFLLKPGVNRTTNGLAIVRMLGLLKDKDA